MEIVGLFSHTLQVAGVDEASSNLPTAHGSGVVRNTAAAQRGPRLQKYCSLVRTWQVPNKKHHRRPGCQCHANPPVGQSPANVPVAVTGWDGDGDDGGGAWSAGPAQINL